MSRVGNKIVEIPSGVQASIQAGLVSVQGPLGALKCSLGDGIEVANVDGGLAVKCVSKNPQARANHGTTRALLSNMVHGVTKGWSKSLELTGVGYNAELKGQTLTLNVGLSHSVSFEVPQGIKVKVAKTSIALEGPDKQAIGNFAAKVRKVRPPEPYLGKGIRIVGEVVRRKAGKAGK